MALITQTIPMFEAAGYRVTRKQVSLGRKPSAQFLLAHRHELTFWIKAGAEHAYFVAEADYEREGTTFKVSGPWDELSITRVKKIEESWLNWLSETASSDATYFYMPQICSYVSQGDLSFNAPTDIGYKLTQWMHRASPERRYPLVPRLPRL